MLFLIEYSRSQGRLVRTKIFSDSEKLKADAAALELELKLAHEGLDHEIVILQAESEEALRRTHGRYFETLEETIDRSKKSLEGSSGALDAIRSKLDRAA